MQYAILSGCIAYYSGLGSHAQISLSIIRDGFSFFCLLQILSVTGGIRDAANAGSTPAHGFDR